MLYYGVAMPRTKSSTATVKKTSKRKGGSAVRDIRPKAKKKAPDFTVQEIKEEDIPKVDPLREDADEFERIADVREETDFKVDKVEMDIDYEPARPPKMDVKSVTEEEKEEPKSEPGFDVSDESTIKDLIKVKFGTFVQLISNRDIQDLFEANADKNIIMHSDLLTELASSRDKREERKIPLVFLVGIAIGVVLTYIFFST
jgi:hypothetical protein